MNNFEKDTNIFYIHICIVYISVKTQTWQLTETVRENFSRIWDANNLRLDNKSSLMLCVYHPVTASAGSKWEKMSSPKSTRWCRDRPALLHGRPNNLVRETGKRSQLNDEVT